MKVFNLQVEAWVGEDGVFKRAENPALQLKEDEPELLGGLHGCTRLEAHTPSHRG